ncbi:hypothetical protein TNCV_3132101 [Trichonephila clavipes]|uniref:Uncharacterized protein n=1 Tax=Trichonephila clavipes TaxID=2585209 RepID=A0A8X6RX23_TRICX|nr:hypothetical protein TNCV_3132101 [Trichonephila clavipes]
MGAINPAEDVEGLESRYIRNLFCINNQNMDPNGIWEHLPPSTFRHCDTIGVIAFSVVKIYRFWNSGAGGARRLRRMQTKEGGSPPGSEPGR